MTHEELVEKVAEAIIDESRNFGALAHVVTDKSYTIEVRLARAAIAVVVEECAKYHDAAAAAALENYHGWCWTGEPDRIEQHKRDAAALRSLAEPKP